MATIAPSPGARRLFTASIVARVPPAMFGIGILVHARQLTGSFAQAGVVVGAYAIALGVGGPLLGQLIDRRGQTSVLLAGAGAAAALLVTIGVLPPRAPLAVLVVVASGIGLATPPVGACLRTQLPALLPTPDAVRSAYALEASLVELTYIAGPALALGIGALWSSGAALAVGGLVLLAATAAFAAQPASRGWRAAPADRPSRGGSLRAPAMRTLVMVLFAVGMLLGADEIAVIAAAATLHSTAGAAPLFVLWGTGSFVGGLLSTRVGGGARTAAGLAVLLGALTAGHLGLIPAAGNLVALGAVLLVAGAAIAPTEATLYAMVDNAAPEGTVTEAFAWLATAMAVGNAAGTAVAGTVVDRAGPTAAFALAGGAGALALLTSMFRSHTPALPRRPGSGSPDSDRDGPAPGTVRSAAPPRCWSWRPPIQYAVAGIRTRASPPLVSSVAVASGDHAPVPPRTRSPQPGGAMPTTTDSAATSNRRWTRLTRPLTVVATAASALAGWVVAGTLLGIDLAVSVGPAGTITRVGPGVVVAVAGVAGVAGWALLAVLERLITRARTAWTSAALVVLVFSLAGPLAATSAAATTALAALHLTVAAVVIAGLRHTTRRPPTDGRHRPTGSVTARSER